MGYSFQSRYFDVWLPWFMSISLVCLLINSPAIAACGVLMWESVVKLYLYVKCCCTFILFLCHAPNSGRNWHVIWTNLGRKKTRRSGFHSRIIFSYRGFYFYRLLSFYFWNHQLIYPWLSPLKWLSKIIFQHRRLTIPSPEFLSLSRRPFPGQLHWTRGLIRN